MTTKMPPIFIIFIDTFSPSKGDNAVPKTNSWKLKYLSGMKNNKQTKISLYT